MIEPGVGGPGVGGGGEGTLALVGGYVATNDGHRGEHSPGHLVLDGARIVAVGAGPMPAEHRDAMVDANGCLVTPSLVNTHHHLCQWLTRGSAARCSAGCRRSTRSGRGTRSP